MVISRESLQLHVPLSLSFAGTSGATHCVKAKVNVATDVFIMSYFLQTLTVGTVVSPVQPFMARGLYRRRELHLP
jgi:hypothetical protein